MKHWSSVLMYDSETIIWKEKERSRIKAIQMDNLNGLLGIRRMDKVPNARLMPWQPTLMVWFDLVEKMEKDRIGKRVYVGECARSHSVGRVWKRWIDTLKDRLRKRGLDCLASKDNGVLCWGFVKGNAWGLAQGMNPRSWDATVVGCYSYMKHLKGGNPFVAEPET